MKMKIDDMRFTLSQVGLIIGKSTQTLRLWDRLGLFDFPRYGRDRVLTTEELRELARAALEGNRIDEERYRKVVALATLMDELRTTRAMNGATSAA
jgi:DNA-binding transcriptional MerR regulator